MKQGCMAAFERLQIERFIVRGALLPTPREDVEPFERSSPYGGLVCLALVTLLLIRGLGPEGVADRFGGPLHKRLAQELRTLEAPVHPGFFPAAFRDRRNAGVFLACLGRGVTLPLFAKGHKEAGGKDRPRPWHGVKQGKIGMILGVVRQSVVEVSQ